MMNPSVSALRAALAVSFAIAAGPVIAGAPEPPVPRFRLAGIELAVDVNYETERISAAASLEIENLADSPRSEVSLLLGRLLRFDRVETEDGSPISYRQDVVTFDDAPKTQVDQAVLALPRPIPPNGRTAIRVEYSGYIVGYTETGSLYIQDHVDPKFTIIRTDAYAIPVVGVPSDRTNRSIPYADFPFDLRATVPADLVVASGGELVERTEKQGRTTWHYRSAAPAPFLNVTIAKYDLVEKDGIRLYAFPEDREGGARVLESARRAVALFRSWFGPTAAPPRFAIIEIPGGYGSQASITGGIIQTASTFRDPGRLVELYHEISHFWNVPDRDSPSPRIDEGLAMYLQCRAAQEIDGRADIDSWLDSSLHRLLGEAKGEPRLGAVPMADYGRAGMTDWSYSVGQLMFDLLEKTVGPAEFREIVGGFYQRYKTDGATTADFADFAESRGGAPVRVLLSEWLTSTRWLERLRTGETLGQMAQRYRSAT
jgi:hypothetical protein